MKTIHVICVKGVINQTEYKTFIQYNIQQFFLEKKALK